LNAYDNDPVLEVGPGEGALTKYLINNEKIKLFLVEVDNEAVVHLKELYPQLRDQIIHADFLKLDLTNLFKKNFRVIGNFPYNISSQILFKILEHKDQVVEMVGMFQKEVADRINASPGNKQYGILSVLLQAFYDVKILFRIKPGAFHPQPRVDSAVVSLKRNKRNKLNCDESRFFEIVKMAFGKRRKMLRNSISNINEKADDLNGYLDKRPEQISVEDFETITRILG
jgi:16S rRNA (adenine1518-N6/adenine1519-N6)-dimethyltransferase